MLRIPRFDTAAASGRAPALAGLAGGRHRSCMVDLRGISGGESEAAFDVAALFAQGELGTLERGQKVGRSFAGAAPPVCRRRDRRAGRRRHARRGRDSRRRAAQKAAAKLVGTPTFGWAGERSRIELEGGGAPAS